jgi:pyruvate dehydrogenase E2 component (dihydrolipoamide acetyltransferase)
VEFRLPDIGEGLSEAELVEWHVAEGQAVVEDQPLVDVQTDKAIVGITCPATGVVERLCFAEGDVVPMGALLVVIAETGAVAGAATGAEAMVVQAAQDGGTEAVAGVAASSDLPARPNARPLASPAVRRLARERGIDLQTIAGSGPGGRIERNDLDTATNANGSASAAPPTRPASAPPAGDQVLRLRGLRRTIARTLSDAWNAVPRVIDYREVRFDALMAARRELKQRASGRGDAELATALTLTPLLLKIVATALRAHPMLNASIDLELEQITLHSRCDLGIATSTPDGLLVPVIRDVWTKSVRELAIESSLLIKAARERQATAEQLSGATFTVNNYGSLGVWLGTPIVVPPQVANLGIGRVEEKPVVVDGQLTTARVGALACSADHRLLDAEPLAAFVAEVVAMIERPILLVEELQ